MIEPPPPTLTIRRATTADAPLVADLGARIFVETFADASSAEDMRDYVLDAFSVERVRDELADPRSIVFIAETTVAAIGFARLHAADAPSGVTGERPIELVRLYVERAHHGSGAGPLLMRHCIDAARAAGHDVMHLGVWEHNPRAIAFYRKHGFERVGEHTFMLGADAQTDWIMQRRL